MSGRATGEDRAAMRAMWRRRGASWNRAAPETVSPDDEFDRLMIEAGAIVPGERVLDLAGGAGDPAISIALRLGAGGRLVATDLAPEMQAAARRRAAALGLANIAFAICDMEALPFAAGTFDAVTCRFGVMFAPDRAAAAGEARRVLRPGGRAVYLVWGPGEDNTIHYVLPKALAAYLGKPPGPPSRRHVLGAPGALAALLADAGFTGIDEREVRKVRHAPAGERFWGAVLERNYGDLLATLDADARAALDATIRAAFAPWREGETYRLERHARLGIGTAPG